MTMTHSEVSSRIEMLETRLRHANLGLVVLALVGGGLVLTPTLRGAWAAPDHADQVQDVIRTRGVIVVDGAGEERILIGQAPGQRCSSQMGIMINDAEGHERFGRGGDR
jgi:hypothetical protein